VSIELKTNSRTNWTVDEKDKRREGNIMLGAVLRIADATEAMAKNYNALLSENEFLNKKNNKLEVEIKDLKNALKAQKSAKTRFKNKLQ
jgi:uncharacterized protein YlxW (UPF0749 family)